VQRAGGTQQPQEVEIAVRARPAPVHQRRLGRQHGLGDQRVDREIGQS